MPATLDGAAPVVEVGRMIAVLRAAAHAAQLAPQLTDADQTSANPLGFPAVGVIAFHRVSQIEAGLGVTVATG